MDPEKKNLDNSIMYQGDDEEKQKKFETLRNKAQKLKNKKKQNKANIGNSIEMEEAKKDLNAFFEHEKALEHLPDVEQTNLLPEEDGLLVNMSEQSATGSGDS